ncbi:MAG TPA: radical SAM family heme chaperone HemW [Tepidisphaeraceae bacterium]|nr:radical SAM family heme chaperone HemW [Tepidisphaeraceae bacterium]
MHPPEFTAQPSPPLPGWELAHLPPAPIEGLYVHVPFCVHKCHYCDFYSITRQAPQRMGRFVDLLLSETEQWHESRSSELLKPQTVFFGGGTPSLLPLESMDRLLKGLKERIDLSGVQEWTVEVNPATANLEYCQMLRGHGVDRLSFGAQSFNLGELATLERRHDPADVPRSIELAGRAGFGRLNLDLIYAVPGQSLESWSDSLEQALSLGTSHLSCYGLTYEPNTPMAVKKRLGLVRPADETLELEMMHHTRHRLARAGMPAYEISNFALPGDQCRHNLVYWTGGNYLGLGPSAASHLEGRRWRNRPHLGEWEAAIASNRLPATDVEQLSPVMRAGELAMLMLRLASGLNFETFSARIGLDASALFPEPIERLTRLGLVRDDGQAVVLTDAGLNVADAVSAEFLDASESD